MATRRALPLIHQIGVMLAITAACTLASQWILPKRIGWVGEWTNYVQNKATKEGVALADVAQAKAIVDAHSHVIFDARKMSDYELGRLPGSLALPPDDREKQFEAWLPILTPSQPILTYCSGKDCDEALELALYLRRNGFTNVVVFLGGFADWSAAHLPIEGASP
jgi:rhodanese-related sulfurtransferase